MKTWQWLLVGAGVAALFVYGTDTGNEIKTAALDEAKRLTLPPDVIADGTMLTPAQLEVAAGSNAAAIADGLNAAAAYALINTPMRWAMFLAQLRAESNFRSRTESLNYSAESILRVWPNRFKTLEDAQSVARNEEALAARVYDNRKDLGNGPGEGFLFRGRGIIQITGKANYTAAGDALGLDLVTDPDVANEPNIAAQIAGWYWRNRKINGPADRGDIERATQLVNGGQTNIDERTQYYNEALAALQGDGLLTS